MIIRWVTTVDHSDWSIACSVGKIDPRAFFLFSFSISSSPPTTELLQPVKIAAPSLMSDGGKADPVIGGGKGHLPDKSNGSDSLLTFPESCDKSPCLLGKPFGASDYTVNEWRRENYCTRRKGR